MIGDIEEGNKGEAVFAQLEGSAADAGKTPLHVCCWAVIFHWGGKTGQEPRKPVLHKSHYIANIRFPQCSRRPFCKTSEGLPARVRCR